MEHFIVIGRDTELGNYVTRVLKSAYPNCIVYVIPVTAVLTTEDEESAALFIFLPDDDSIHAGFLAARSTLVAPAMAIAETVEKGLAAVEAGADDFLLVTDIEKQLEYTVPKVIARKTYRAAAQATNSGDALLSPQNKVVWSRNADDFRLIYINEACEQLYGYTQEELIADPDIIIMRIHDEDRQCYIDALLLMRETGKLQEYDFRLRTKDGTLKYFKGTGGLVKGKEGKHDLLTGITADITSVVKSESILREKATELENILGAISDCFYSVDKNWNFTYINKALECLYQVKREDLIGKNLWSTYPALQNSVFYERYHQAMADQKNVSFEAFSPHIKLWLFVTVYPSENGLTIFFKDVTERKKLKERAVAYQQNLNSIINTTTDLIWLVDRDLNILAANNAFWDIVCQNYGKTRAEMGTRITAETYGKEMVDYWKELYARGFEGTPYKVVEKGKRATGVTYSELSMNPVLDDDGNVVGLSCFSRDITTVRQHMLQIEDQNDKLLEIAWIQSHKVRGPVSTILGLADLFDRNEVSGETNEKIIEGIRETTLYLDEVIREIVDKAKLIT